MLPESPLANRVAKDRGIASQDKELNDLLSSIPDSEGTDTLAPREDIDQGKNAVDHLTGVFKAAAVGPLKAMQEMGNTAIEGFDLIENFLSKNGYGDGKIVSEKDLLTFADDLYQPQGWVEKGISGITQFLVPISALNKATKGVKALQTASTLGRIAKEGAFGAAVTFSSFDPEEGNLSNLIQTVPWLRNPLTEFMAANPKDPRPLNRFKNALEGLGLGVAADALISGVKMYRGSRVYESVMKDADELLKKADKAGLEIPEYGAEIADDVVKQMDGLKSQVKSDRVAKPLEQLELDLGDVDNLGGYKKFSDYAKSQVENFDDMVFKAKRGVITDSELKQLADVTGDKVETLKNRMLGDVENAENVLANSITLGKKLDSMDVVEKALLKDPENPQLIAKYLSMVDEGSVLVANAGANESELGRALRAIQVARDMTDNAQSRMLKDIVKNGRGDALKMAEAMQEARKSGGKVAAKEIMNTTLGNKYADAAYEGWLQSILSNVVTHVKNVGTNTMVLGNSVAERYAARISSKTSAVKKAMKAGDSLSEAYARGSLDSVVRGEADAYTKGITGGLNDAWIAAKKTFKTGTSQFEKSEKFARNTKGKLSSKALGLDENTLGARGVDALGKYLGYVTKSLEAEDEFFKVLNYRGEMHAQAHRKALLTQASQNISDDLVGETFQKFLKNPSQDMIDAAINNAKQNTFTKDLSQVTIMGYSPQKLDDFIKSAPLLRIVAPFTKTNFNMVEYAINRTPLLGPIRADIAAGGLRRDQAMARMGVGGLFMATMGTLAYNGFITGTGPEDRTARLPLEAAGQRPKEAFGIPLESMGTFGSMARIAADTAELIHALGNERAEEGTELAMKVTGSLMTYFTPEFVTRSMVDFMEAATGDERKMEGFLAGIARGSVPFSSLAREGNKRFIDPVARNTMADPDSPFPIIDRMLNEVKATIPGLSNGWTNPVTGKYYPPLPPRRNILGEAITYKSFAQDPDNIGPLVNEDGPFAKEVLRLNSAKGAGAKDYLKIDMPDKFIRIMGETVKLSPQEYDRYVLLSSGQGLILSPFPGKTLRQILDEQVTKNYPLLGDAPKNDETKILLIKEIISQYRKGAREQLLMESSDIQQDFINQATERASRISGQRLKFNL